MTTQQAWRLAFGAARRAMRAAENDAQPFQSGFVAALDATASFSGNRFTMCQAAERCAEMTQSWRLRRGPARPHGHLLRRAQGVFNVARRLQPVVR